MRKFPRYTYPEFLFSSLEKVSPSKVSVKLEQKQQEVLVKAVTEKFAQPKSAFAKKPAEEVQTVSDFVETDDNIAEKIVVKSPKKAELAKNQPQSIYNKFQSKESRDDVEAKLLQLQKDMFEHAAIEYKSESQFVFNDGTIDSPVMFVGEAPGEDEVLKKKPFVGKSGQILQNMLDAAGLTRDRIYITNTVVWRPPLNRTPLPAEIEEMSPYLLRHIDILKPKILVFIGGVAYRCAMKEAIAISKIRGIWQTRYFCPSIINIFHPSYLIRAPSRKKETWADILSIRQKVLETGWLLGKGLLRV